jgi:hypothetical protein
LSDETEVPTNYLSNSGANHEFSENRRPGSLSDPFEEDKYPKGLSVDAPELYPARERRHDTVRVIMVVALLLILLFLMLAPWISLWLNSKYDTDAKDLFSLMSAPLIGLIGAAIGFYFGERSMVNH